MRHIGPNNGSPLYRNARGSRPLVNPPALSTMVSLGGSFVLCGKVLDECGTVGQGAFRSTKPMNLIKLLLLAALIATVIVFFAEGPDLLTIIDQH